MPIRMILLKTVIYFYDYCFNSEKFDLFQNSICYPTSWYHEWINSKIRGSKMYFLKIVYNF